MSDNARERAYDKAIDVVRILVGDETQIDPDGEYGLMVKAIATALERERREAEQAQMERDCKAMCDYCKGGTIEIDGIEYQIQPAMEEVDGWYHDLTSKEIDEEPVGCRAVDIHIAYAERLRDKATP